MIAIAPWFKLSRAVCANARSPADGRPARSRIAVVGYGREMGFAVMRELTQEKSIWVNVR